MNQYERDVYYGIEPDKGEYDGEWPSFKCEGCGVEVDGEGPGLCIFCFINEHLEKPTVQNLDKTVWDEGEVTPC
jgi:hypothetical protein